MTTLADSRPLFTDLGELARTITEGIRNAEAQGVKAKAIHINPQMLEVMDQMKGERILKIGNYNIVPNPKTPMDRFWVEKA